MELLVIFAVVLFVIIYLAPEKVMQTMLAAVWGLMALGVVGSIVFSVFR